MISPAEFQWNETKRIFKLRTCNACFFFNKKSLITKILYFHVIRNEAVSRKVEYFFSKKLSKAKTWNCLQSRSPITHWWSRKFFFRVNTVYIFATSRRFHKLVYRIVWLYCLCVLVDDYSISNDYIRESFQTYIWYTHACWFPYIV